MLCETEPNNNRPAKKVNTHAHSHTQSTHLLDDCSPSAQLQELLLVPLHMPHSNGSILNICNRLPYSLPLRVGGVCLSIPRAPRAALSTSYSSVYQAPQSLPREMKETVRSPSVPLVHLASIEVLPRRKKNKFCFLCLVTGAQDRQGISPRLTPGRNISASARQTCRR